MPMLADIDDPRPSRVRGFLIGAAIAVPVGLVFWWFASSWLPGLILGNAVEYDARLRQEDAYMQGVCANMDLARDESLCECVLAVEYPSLDCRLPFMHWSLVQMVETCSDDAVFKQSLSFCSCVRSLDEQLGAVAPDTKEARQIVQTYASCTELADALFLPALEQL
ncbi:hypothetical protein DB30_04158 [Enhygromyxa salina]|uniref:Uncharacterized protein n=1 Tax=Enhygromyxa salina TaxID=215803 RepID=A0A0C2D4Q9_9BACT|nr:hypothetical protein [Enhygromyxa salina]KIG16685.1 hypothetical protein DB30_04158 [Enhygromyxa salina]